MLTTLPQTLNLRLDQLIIAGFLPARSLGLYVAAVAWSAALAPVLTAVGIVLFPKLAGSADAAARASMFQQATRMSVALSVLLVGGALLLTPLAMRVLFGSAFTSAVPSALVLVVAGGVLGVTGVLEDGLRGLGAPVAVLVAETTGLAVTALSLLVLLPLLGILGAAISSLLGYSLVGAVVVVQSARRLECDTKTLLLPRPHDFRLLVASIRRSRQRVGA